MISAATPPTRARFFPLLYRRLIACAALLAAGCGLHENLAAQTPPPPAKDNPMTPIIHAPELPKQYAWLNTDQALQFSGSLKGQVVLMDFWTYCCINCMHVLPDLDYLEQKYKDQPVVILGVHSAKYDNEQDAANIRAAIQRYQIHHPIIIDENHSIWDSYDVSAWPTLVLVGSDGKIIGAVSGEDNRDLLDHAITKALDQGKDNGTLAAAPLKLAHEGEIRSASGLSFPAKVIADAAGKRFLILDSNHNRILVAGYPAADGRLQVNAIIGSGQAGAADGAFAAASFNRPQGATIMGNTLWVADTENHLIRRVDLDKKTVTTVLGTGQKVFDREAGKSGREQGLNSPWDVAVLGNRLYIAQAGQHQLFAMNLMTGMTEVAAGSGRENIRDGNAEVANLAQPSGLAMDAAKQILYFADSEVSAIRGLNLQTHNVFTLVGHGLFDFGDIDGEADKARLQHPLGLCLSPDGEGLFVTDTYNHKIKYIDLATKHVWSIAGTGKSGTATMPATASAASAGTPAVEFFEPESLAVDAQGNAFIADTNNHRIVRLDLKRDPAAGDASPWHAGAWKELIVDGLAAPGSGEMAADKNARDGGKLSLAAGKNLALLVALKLPFGEHLTPGAPISLKVTDGTRILYTTSLMAVHLPLDASIPAENLADHPQQLYVMVYYTHCRDGINSVCTPAKDAWKLATDFSGQGAAIDLHQ